MPEINIYRKEGISANISQLNIKRDWMDNTFEKHAYRCLPVSSANNIGLGISFPEDISFVWDGITDTSPNHIKILKGEKYCSLGRANATLSFNTELYIRTENNISMLHMPVPNLFVDGIEAYTTIISTSFFNSPFPSAIRITSPNKIITIKANQPIACIMPISLSNLNNFDININSLNKFPVATAKEVISKSKRKLIKGIWTDYYRDGVDPNGNLIGFHEVKSIKYNIKEIN